MDASREVETIAHVIQLAIAPVFLLTGIGSLLAVITNRLGRIIDRARLVEREWSAMTALRRDAARLELASLSHRAACANLAINFYAYAALLVCALIAALFIDVIVGVDLRWIVGALFVLAMLVLSTGILFFLREIYVATHTLRIGPPTLD